MKPLRLLLLASSFGVFPLTPTVAGEEILYAPAPDWVEVKPLIAADSKGAPLVLIEQQVRLEGGTVTSYNDMAMRLSSPEALTQAGTLTAQWMPDKGDLVIHRVELLRDGTTVDVIAQGARFDALRRERQLEQRVVDGIRTASLALPGARVGDVVRLAYSVSTRDQALGDEMQWEGMLLAKPVPLDRGNITISWPAGEDIRWRAKAVTAGPQPVERRGYRYLSFDLPIDKQAEMPGDAPLRYLMPPIIGASSFSGWSEVSEIMAPLYLRVLGIAADSDLARQVERIKLASTDPLIRVALATRLVQDEISYLANGMDGGNYIPQAPAETWEQRYGDCKAKSLLLAALLRVMDIEAEPMLVRTSAGDALPEMLPMPGGFDHVIVHAVVDGTDYWLDGTSAGARIDNIAIVPPFHYGLPLRAEGAELIALSPRLPSGEGDKLKLVIDSSAGISVPAMYKIDIELTGASAAPVRAMAGQIEGQLLEQMVSSIVSAALGDTQLLTHDLSWDQTKGVANVTASGVMTTPWRREQEVYQLQPPGQPAANISFAADRARSAWRDIPLRLNGPSSQHLELSVVLPDGGRGFAIVDGAEIDETLAGIAVRSTADLKQRHFTLTQSVVSAGGELPAANIAAAQRDSARIQRQLPQLRAPEGARARWNYKGTDRELLGPLERAFSQLIDKAAEDEIAQAYANRAAFRAGTFDFSAAKSDLDKAIEHEASIALHYQRAAVLTELGDLESSLSDLQTAEALEAKGESYASQIELLGLLGRADEGVALAREYGPMAESEEDASQLIATALMWEGNSTEALAVLAKEAGRRPGDGELLNAQCWEAGVWAKIDDAMLDVCTRAVEKSDWSANALDSRAMAYFRLGRLSEARADLDAVVSKAPEIAESRFMRGVVLLAQGDKGGRDEVQLALHMKPSLAHIYAAYGIKP